MFASSLFLLKLFRHFRNPLIYHVDDIRILLLQDGLAFSLLEWIPYFLDFMFFLSFLTYLSFPILMKHLSGCFLQEQFIKINFLNALKFENVFLLPLYLLMVRKGIEFQLKTFFFKLWCCCWDIRRHFYF